MCVYLYVYIHVYVYIYTHTQKQKQEKVINRAQYKQFLNFALILQYLDV